MKLAGYVTLSDPKGNIQFASKFTLGESKQGLAGIGCRIDGLIGMDVKHFFGLYAYAMLGHEDFCEGAWYMSPFRITTTGRNYFLFTFFLVLPLM